MGLFDIPAGNMSVRSDRSVASANMQKWGIPENYMVPCEVTLLERLVWVPYRGHWWPALLYENYTELQDHLYNDLEVKVKAQFAAAIMRQLNNPKPIKIARLLGRQALEVLEVDVTEYAEFYWQLPKVLPMACRKSKYGNDTKLYLDFHRALDQVEEIIRDISEQAFKIDPVAGRKTWVQRAQEALAVPSAETSIANDNASRGSSKLNSIKLSDKDYTESLMKGKETADEEEYNFLFAALDNVMERCNTTYDCVEANTCGNYEEPVLAENQTFSVTLPELSKQRETRDALRKVLEKQRHLREHGTVAGTTNCVVDDEARNPSADEGESLVKTPSTDVLPGVDSEDTILWKLLNPSYEEKTQIKYPSNIPLGPSRSAHEAPELVTFTPKKVLAQPIQGQPSSPEENPIDSREDYQEDDREADDREAIKAAARAAAAMELEAGFWETISCYAMDS